jgi:hypothetical protein
MNPITPVITTVIVLECRGISSLVKQERQAGVILLHNLPKM